MSGTQVRQVIYFGLAAIGLVGTAYFNQQWFSNDVFDHTAEGFVRPMFANSASSSGGVDLIVTCVAAWVLMVTEARARGMKLVWLYIIGSMLTAIAFAFPLFLGMRERKMAASAT
jgi:ABC-type glycerol-3-phosphate transport system permease component